MPHNIQRGIQGKSKSNSWSCRNLVRLRENGYRIAVVTNGQIEDQETKAEAIGIRHLVDRILTSEEAGCCKPDYRIFHTTIEAMVVSPTSPVHMVGDSRASIRDKNFCIAETAELWISLKESEAECKPDCPAHQWNLSAVLCYRLVGITET